MSLDTLKTLDIIEVMEGFLERKRPPEEIRNKVDLGYKIEGQSIFIFEIRPQWNKPEIIHEYPFARITFVKAQNHWKVYWMRGNGKWYRYDPEPIVEQISRFVQLVEEDKHHCFLG
jgi:hypothetical protein